jgi:ankyrin repeat protein
MLIARTITEIMPFFPFVDITKRKIWLKSFFSLIKHGIDVNCKDNNGLDAISILIFYYKKKNLIEIIRLLIENGFDTKAQSTPNYIFLELHKNDNLMMTI